MFKNKIAISKNFLIAICFISLILFAVNTVNAIDLNDDVSNDDALGIKSSNGINAIDKDKLGKVNSVIDVGSQGLIPLSNFLAGLVISGLGASWLCIISTAGLSFMTIFLVLNKHVKQLWFK